MPIPIPRDAPVINAVFPDNIGGKVNKNIGVKVNKKTNSFWDNAREK
jgi:hypothetical protein